MIKFGVVFADANLLPLKSMKKIKYLVIVLAAIFALGSCRKIEQLSAVPHIKFTSFTIFDTVDILGNMSKGGRLKFSFEDGDGDLGLAVPSDNQTDTTNLFFTLFRKTGGIMAAAPDNDPLKPSSYRIPYMSRSRCRPDERVAPLAMVCAGSANGLSRIIAPGPEKVPW